MRRTADIRKKMRRTRKRVQRCRTMICLIQTDCRDPLALKHRQRRRAIKSAPVGKMPRRIGDSTAAVRLSGTIIVHAAPIQAVTFFVGQRRRRNQRFDVLCGEEIIIKQICRGTNDTAMYRRICVFSRFHTDTPTSARLSSSPSMIHCFRKCSNVVLERPKA